MKKKCLIKEVSILLIVVLLLSSAGVLAANTTSQKVEIEGRIMSPTENTWYVPDDFGTIQGAIDSDLVKDGDTVFVRNGKYCEDIEIDKSIKLIGENRETTIIDANGEDYAVSIGTSYVVIRGFTIQGATGVGIVAYNPYGDPPVTNENTITDNIITNNKYGLSLTRSSGNTITGNIITGNRRHGICLEGSSDNTISGNTIENNEWAGIELASSSGNHILGNTIINNSIGIDIMSSSGNDISGNTIENNGWKGIDLTFSSGNDILGNTIANNNNEGIDLTSSSSNDILGNTITNNTFGIALWESSDNTIGGATDDLKNTISNNICGISIDSYSEGYSRTKLRENNKFNNNIFNIVGGSFSKSEYLPLDKLLPGC